MRGSPSESQQPDSVRRAGENCQRLRDCGRFQRGSRRCSPVAKTEDKKSSKRGFLADFIKTEPEAWKGLKAGRIAKGLSGLWSVSRTQEPERAEEQRRSFLTDVSRIVSLEPQEP